MAGVSVQAFRRQGRRFGAGLVCSEMVSCAGLSHGNERTLGYLRIGRDERPLAVQIFGSEPGVMAEAARMVEDAGADLLDVNFGCPVRKVTKTGAGATLLEDPERACGIVEAVAGAVGVPVTVKMRRGLEDGSRAALELGPRLVEAGAASLTLHPRSARQMYTGMADHALTAELAELVLFMRATVDELGERRALGFLKKFYGWYLGRGRFPKPFKQELVRLETLAAVEERLLAAAPGAHAVLARLEADAPQGEDVLLDLPISVYSGG